LLERALRDLLDDKDEARSSRHLLERKAELEERNVQYEEVIVREDYSSSETSWYEPEHISLSSRSPTPSSPARSESSSSQTSSIPPWRKDVLHGRAQRRRANILQRMKEKRDSDFTRTFLVDVEGNVYIAPPPLDSAQENNTDNQQNKHPSHSLFDPQLATKFALRAQAQHGIDLLDKSPTSEFLSWMIDGVQGISFLLKHQEYLLGQEKKNSQRLERQRARAFRRGKRLARSPEGLQRSPEDPPRSLEDPRRSPEDLPRTPQPTRFVNVSQTSHSSPLANRNRGESITVTRAPALFEQPEVPIAPQSHAILHRVQCYTRSHKHGSRELIPRLAIMILI